MLAIDEVPPVLPQERLGRAARMAFGGAAAVAALTTVTACGKSARDPNENLVMPYGAPQPTNLPESGSNVMMHPSVERAPPEPPRDAASTPIVATADAGGADAAADAGKKIAPKPTATVPPHVNVNKPYGAPPADGYDVFDV